MYVNLVVYNLVCYLTLFYAEFFLLSVHVSSFFFPLTTDLVTSSALGKQPRFYCF